MSRSLYSHCEGHFDVRAPLATFDTIDLGEENFAILHKDISKFPADIQVKDDNNKGQLLGPIQLCQPHADRNERPKLEIAAATGAYHKLEDDDKSDQMSRSEDFVEGKFSPDSFSDTCSSDSENGYTQSGFVSVSDGKIIHQEFPVAAHLSSPFTCRHAKFNDHDISQENTPVSSPCLPRRPLPDLLKELGTVKSESKRKALEKRIQRLQVTTKPVERPRSTTPINIFSLDEYKEIRSPEIIKPDHHEKLKIKLPAEDYCYRQKSPRRSRQYTPNTEPSVFNFNEEHLFTHTKSALLVQNDGSVGNSPKRILIPPSCSPSSSPVVSPAKLAHRSASPGASQKYYYKPSSQSPLKQGQTFQGPQQVNLSGLVQGNSWAHFDDVNFGSQVPTNVSSNVSKGYSNVSSQETRDLTKTSTINAEALSDIQTVNKQKLIDDAMFMDEDCDEVITVNVEEFKNGQKICDIEVGVVNNNVVNTSNLPEEVDSQGIAALNTRTEDTNVSTDTSKSINSDCSLYHDQSNDKAKNTYQVSVHSSIYNTHNCTDCKTCDNFIDYSEIKDCNHSENTQYLQNTQAQCNQSKNIKEIVPNENSLKNDSNVQMEPVHITINSNSEINSLEPTSAKLENAADLQTVENINESSPSHNNVKCLVEDSVEDIK